MCDFRNPYFIKNNLPVPCGGGIDYRDINYPEKFENGKYYVVMLTGSWSLYCDGNRFYSADQENDLIYWKYIHPWIEVEI